MNKIEIINNASANSVFFPNDLIRNNLNKYGIKSLDTILRSMIMQIAVLTFMYKNVNIDLIMKHCAESKSAIISYIKKLYEMDLIVITKGTIDDIENCDFQLNDKYFYLH